MNFQLFVLNLPQTKPFFSFQVTVFTFHGEGEMQHFLLQMV